MAVECQAMHAGRCPTLQSSRPRLACAHSRLLTATLGGPVGIGYDNDDSSGHVRSRWSVVCLGRTVMRLVVKQPATAVVLLLLSASLGTAAAQPGEGSPGGVSKSGLLF